MFKKSVADTNSHSKITNKKKSKDLEPQEVKLQLAKPELTE